MRMLIGRTIVAGREVIAGVSGDTDVDVDGTGTNGWARGVIAGPMFGIIAGRDGAADAAAAPITPEPSWIVAPGRGACVANSDGEKPAGAVLSSTGIFFGFGSVRPSPPARPSSGTTGVTPKGTIPGTTRRGADSSVAAALEPEVPTRDLATIKTNIADDIATEHQGAPRLDERVLHEAILTHEADAQRARLSHADVSSEQSP